MGLSADRRIKFESVARLVDGACAEVGRPRADVVLVGVIKGQPREAVEAFIAWCRDVSLPAVVGVNYVQEYRDMKPQLAVLPAKVHFIGRLQKNKARDAVALFDVIETVDSIELARVIDKEAQRIGKVQDIFLQVNISSDDRKAGFEPAEVKDVVLNEIAPLKHLRLCGLMTITRFYETAEEARPDFEELSRLGAAVSRDAACRGVLGGRGLDLSMGMSQDFPAAIKAGSGFVRVGSALFGPRGNAPSVEKIS